MTTRSPLVVSARVRILAWIMLAVTVATVIVIAATGTLMFARVESRAETEILHEVEKFRDFAERSDTATGVRYQSVETVLTAHLENNLPEHEETLFTLVNGAPYRRSAAEPPARLDRDQEFVTYAGRVRTPELGRWATEAGPVVYGVIPVEVEGQEKIGHLVIVEFLQEDYEEARGLLGLMGLIGAVTLGGAGLIGWFITGQVLAPIRELQATAAGISETDLGRRIDVVGNDDVARLAQTFNGMLDRLASAFEGQRQFLDDAGHELRTPITIVRGHLELMGDDPEEQRTTLALVQDELSRMGRLVDDLILLARSERPDFIHPDPVNLTELIVETFAKATALAERTWMLDETPDAIAVVDSERLAQALLQLAVNAVFHTSTGAVIAFGGSVDPVGARALLWVRDEGEGIAQADQGRIFDRFVRGGGAGDRAERSGLGLAIVHRIVEAHGGRVSVSSAPGEGARFTLTVPLREGG